MSYLDELALKHRPTKMEHDYLRHYSNALEARRLAFRNVIEVGVQDGNSVRMWQEYFPNAVIHGVDIDSSYKIHEDSRIRIWVLDSTNKRDTDGLINEIDGDIDVMIDDGSHHPFDQISTFKNLFPHLSMGGTYFVEDVGGTRGPLRLRALNAFMELAEAINYWPKSMSAAHVGDFSDFETDNYWIRNVVGVAFFRYLIVVSKGRNPMRDLSNEEMSVASPPGPQVEPRPEVSLSRLRELPWPKFRPRRHFVKRREVKPESTAKLAWRYLTNRW